MVTVTLTWAEVHLGAMVGIQRQCTNLRDGRADRYDVNPYDDGFGYHIMGAHGEMAVAKFKNVFWSGAVGKLYVADLEGTRIQVRTTGHPTGRLVVHKPPPRPGERGDSPDDYFVLARVALVQPLGALPLVHLIGWKQGYDAQQEEYWQTIPTQPRRPAYFVDNDDLEDMDDLPALASSRVEAA